ncbi:MAG: cytochrome C, partial [Deltaproteobacteria bacterium]|nr:cytochrome C [Deltaproteobacteria bacterium]
MKKIVMLVALVAFMAMSVVAFAAPAGPAGELTVTAKMKSDKKPAVKFAHEKHEALACKDCHHTWEGEGDPKKCSECHTGRKSGEKINNKV